MQIPKFDDNCLSKIAIDLMGLRKANSASKIIRGAISSEGHLSRKSVGSIAFPERNIAKIYNSPEDFNLFNKSNIPSGSIFSGKGGGIKTVNYVNRAKAGSKNIKKRYKKIDVILKSPNENEAFNRIVNMHEAFEGTVKPRDIRKFKGHLSPNVILKEHNIVKTLPDNLSKVRESFKDFRYTTGDNAAMRDLTNSPYNGGFVYGTSPRLSRHAIKRMVESIKANRKSTLYI